MYWYIVFAGAGINDARVVGPGTFLRSSNRAARTSFRLVFALPRLALRQAGAP
jgi:hypothetical protein